MKPVEAPEFEALPVTCALSEVALEEALRVCGYQPPEVTLYVHSKHRGRAVQLLSSLSSNKPDVGTKEGPLHPYINLKCNDELPVNGWCVEVNGQRAGSEGV